MADEYYEDDYEDDFEDDDEARTPPPPVAPTPAPISADIANNSSSPQRPMYSRSPSCNFPWALVTMDELDMEEKLAAGAMGAVHAGFYRGRPVAEFSTHTCAVIISS